MELGHAIGALGDAEAELGHVEHVPALLDAEGERRLDRQRGDQLGQARGVGVEVAAQLRGVEAVDAGGHRCGW